MIVTDIRIRKVNTEGRMKAIVSITFDDAFAVHVNTVVSAPSARRFSTMLPMIWPHLAASKHHS